MDDTVSISDSTLSAHISPLGAELVRLQDGNGLDLLWNGDPAFWTGRSPLLFPIVGRVHGDRIQVDGRHYALPQHGFARTQTFMLIDAAPNFCRWSLRSNEATLSRYPFP